MVSNKIYAENRRLFHDFSVETTMEAGLVLLGSEVKSIRTGKCSVIDAVVVNDGSGISVLKMNINRYLPAGKSNHDPLRPKRLLLHKNQIIRLISTMKEGGFMVLVTKVYDKNNVIKCEVAVCKKLKLFDKRAMESEKEWRKERKQLIGSGFYE